MTTVLLVRHGRSTANTAKVLAGRTPGVDLDDTGRRQASDLATRLAGVELAAAVVSPMARCRQTADLVLAGRELQRHTDDRLTECDYGDWSNRPLKDLSTEQLWRSVQSVPSRVTFPGGEAMAAMSQRAVAAVADWNARLARDHGDHAVWLAVSHGDVIKAVVADALGLHLDQFQRIVVDPGSVTVVSLHRGVPTVITTNAGADLAARIPAAPPAEATPGGSTGSPDATEGPSGESRGQGSGERS